jgi:hypothetical protein
VFKRSERVLEGRRIGVVRDSIHLIEHVVDTRDDRREHIGDPDPVERRHAAKRA